LAIADMPPDVAAPAGNLWVFGYGSLMWRPGFDHIDARPARLRGFHRAFCMSSIHYRGTVEKPGLVLGLAPGGSCVGRAFEVAADQRLGAIAYLRERELISYVYHERVVSVQIAGQPGLISALTYIADRDGPQFEPDGDIDAQALRIATCSGSAGTNADYLRQTIAHLSELGIKQRRLSDLMARVEAILAQPQRE
jgi:cation transport protein ChaC